MAEYISQENGEALNPPTSKSPGKSKKLTLGSLFKRSTTDDSGLRGSSKERGSSRSKKKKSSDISDSNHDLQTRLTVSMEMSRNEEQRTAGSIKGNSAAHIREPEEGLQEPEQKSIGDLSSSKKAQKKNKELSKQNNQLAKSVDALKKEREELLSDKQKLKSENKTLERELKKVNSKGDLRLHKKSSQVSVDQTLEFDTMEDMSLKVQALEARLAERDGKLRRVRERLQRLNSEMPGVGLSLENEEGLRRESLTSPPEMPPNGSLLDSSVLERLLDEKNKAAKLKVENSELKVKVAALEGSLAQIQAAREGAEKTRRRSGHFFRRNKTHSKSMVMKSSEEVAKERDVSKEKDTHRSRSPDFLSISDSSHDISGTLSCIDLKAGGSVPNFVYSGLSPRTAAKRAHADVQTLQSCLKLAIEEKKGFDEQIKQLEIELSAARDTINKEKALVEEKTKALEEIESSRDALLKGKDELSTQVSSLQASNEQLKSEKVALEKRLAASDAEKNGKISSLQDEIKQLQARLAESEKIRKESEDVFQPPSVQQTAQKREVKGPTKSVVSKPPIVPASQSKPSGKEEEADSKTRKTSQPRMRRRSSSSSLSSDEHYDSVANTRALFEQKIGTIRDDNQSPKRSPRKNSLTEERRSSYSNISPALNPVVNHAKSSSFDATKIVAREKTKPKDAPKSPTSPLKTGQKSAPQQSSVATTNSTVSEKAKPKDTPKSPTSPLETGQKSATQQSSVATTNSTVSKPTSLSSNKSTSGAKIQSFTSTNKETTPASKASKIIITSTTTSAGSPVLSRPKSFEQKIAAPGLHKQFSVPANLYKAASSPQTVLVDTRLGKKEIPVKVPMATTSSVKRTVVTPVRSNSAVIASSPTSPSTATPAKVTITATNTNVNTANKSENVVLRGGRANKPRPQSMLLVPTSMKKASSLQDIPEQTGSSFTVGSVQPPAPTKPAEPVVVQRNPTPRRFQRRERSDRPKTMYAGKAETTNLVNLISRFQQQETTKKESPPVPATTITPIKENKVLNGVSSLGSTPSLKVTTSPSSSSGVILRNSSSPRAPRPNSYYGAPTEKVVNVKNPLSPVSYKKPPPSERPLLRAQTVGSGLGFNKQSKKAMLLRWCQRETLEYENVRIQNFDTSFSDGLAFCALIHHFVPDKVPYNTLNAKNRQHNFTLAFKVAEEAGIPALLDVEDMVDLPIPDWMSVMTYVSFIYNKFGQPNNTT